MGERDNDVIHVIPFINHKRNPSVIPLQANVIGDAKISRVVVLPHSMLGLGMASIAAITFTASKTPTSQRWIQVSLKLLLTF